MKPPIVGDVYRNPRGRDYRILSLHGNHTARVVNVRTGDEDDANWPLMTPENGWHLISVSCKTCGQSTTFTGTKQCNNCHEVELRLDEYLRRGGINARTFVAEALSRDCDRRKTGR